MRIRDPGWVEFEFGIRFEIRIRDKHPGSATLMALYFFTLQRIEKLYGPFQGIF
jgi:hypothetical protein